MQRYVIGVDEAGRGPLAGPVAVGVVCVPKNFSWNVLSGVTDSKQLSEKKREEIFSKAQKLQQKRKLDFSVSMVSASIIDRVGIVKAVNLAMRRALKKLNVNPDDCMVQLDGSLYAPEVFTYQKTIIGGDKTQKAISLASVVAKVTRDRYMKGKSAQTPFAYYNFHIHKGYGTKKHRELIKKHGLSTLHRHTYCKNVKVL